MYQISMKSYEKMIPILPNVVLKVASVIRIGRLAVVEGDILLGALDKINPGRTKRIKNRLAEWLTR